MQLARQRGSRSFALRAALSLARSEQSRGERDGRGSQALAELYGSFNEGFDTPDLVEAREILANG